MLIFWAFFTFVYLIFKAYQQLFTLSTKKMCITVNNIDNNIVENI